MKNLIKLIETTKWYNLYKLCSAEQNDELLSTTINLEMIHPVAQSANLTNNQFLFLLNINNHFINYNLGLNNILTENQINLLLNKNDYNSKPISGFNHVITCKAIAENCKLNQSQIDFILSLDHDNSYNLLVNKHLSIEQKEKIIERRLKQEVFK